MKKVAVVKKQLGKLGYKLNYYAKSGKKIPLYLGKPKNYKQKLLVVLNYQSQIVVYSPTGFYNCEVIPSLKNLKSAVYTIENRISKHKKDMLELRDKLKEEN